mmetsp:Transcript_90714/g.189619  ORF Transcript_90714/g.189619 Transcript_90714/m.189619 type:complete len:336 (+) Transcript_90714:126-1133(+)
MKEHNSAPTAPRLPAAQEQDFVAQVSSSSCGERPYISRSRDADLSHTPGSLTSEAPCADGTPPLRPPAAATTFASTAGSTKWGGSQPASEEIRDGDILSREDGADQFQENTNLPQRQREEHSGSSGPGESSGLRRECADAVLVPMAAALRKVESRCSTADTASPSARPGGSGGVAAMASSHRVQPPMPSGEAPMTKTSRSGGTCPPGWHSLHSRTGQSSLPVSGSVPARPSWPAASPEHHQVNDPQPPVVARAPIWVVAEVIDFRLEAQLLEEVEEAMRQETLEHRRAISSWRPSTKCASEQGMFGFCTKHPCADTADAENVADTAGGSAEVGSL